MNDDVGISPAMTRRHFIRSGVKLAGIAVVAGSVGTVGKGFFFPRPTDDVEAGFPDIHCGTNTTGEGSGADTPQILVAYASEFGTTGEVAQFIGQGLCKQGFDVRVQSVAEVQDLDQYSAVIVGGAIQFDKWMAEATDFIRSNEETLSLIPVSYFFTCLTLSESSAKAKTKADGYAEKVAATSKTVRPLSVGRFAGVLEYKRMAFATLLASKVIYSLLGVKEGDYRDWEAIADWSQDTGAQGSQP